MAHTHPEQLDSDQAIAEPAPPDEPVATVLHTGGVHFASEKAVVERALGAQPGVTSVECNPVAQTATVNYDPRRTNVAELRRCVEACGYDCAGESVPSGTVEARLAPLPRGFRLRS